MKPAWRRAGDGSSTADRRLVAAAATTVSDVVSRWWVNYDGTGTGLRGGSWTYDGDDPVEFELDEVELVPGVRVSGTASWVYGGGTTADVTVTGPRSAGSLSIRWANVRAARAQLVGDVDGRRVRATMLAP